MLSPQAIVLHLLPDFSSTVSVVTLVFKIIMATKDRHCGKLELLVPTESPFCWFRGVRLASGHN